MDAQYDVKRLVLAERYRFYKCKQQEGQSLAIYLAELRKLAVTCDWTEEQLANNLRDKPVCNGATQRTPIQYSSC